MNTYNLFETDPSQQFQNLGFTFLKILNFILFIASSKTFL